MLSLEKEILDLINQSIRVTRAQPLFLGGTTASGGGSGAPAAGTIGQLTQTRVTYDLSEDEDNTVPASGASLLHNLNRIRYRIAQIEASGVSSSGTFLGLSDSPDSYIGQAGKSVVVNATEDGLEFTTVSGGVGDIAFTDLTDAPSTYSGQAGKSVVVNNTENGLEFTTISGGTGASAFTDLTDVPTTYSGQAGNMLVVKATEDGLEFVTSTTSSGTTINYEELDSQVDGVEDHFYTTYTIESGSIQVFYNGLLQNTSSYVVDVDGVGFVLDFVPASGDGLSTVYWISASGGTPTPPAEEYQTPEYSHTGGTGDRRSIITLTTNIVMGGGGDYLQQIDGSFADWSQFTVQSSVGKHITFNFGAKKLITESKHYQPNSSSHGIWEWQGSNDGVDYTPIGADFTFGGEATQVMTSMSENTTGYQYYRIYGISGTMSLVYSREFEFKIGGLL